MSTSEKFREQKLPETHPSSKEEMKSALWQKQFMKADVAPCPFSGTHVVNDQTYEFHCGHYFAKPLAASRQKKAKKKVDIAENEPRKMRCS
jgi:hypothetical protein